MVQQDQSHHGRITELECNMMGSHVLYGPAACLLHKSSPILLSEKYRYIENTKYNLELSSGYYNDVFSIIVT